MDKITITHSDENQSKVPDLRTVCLFCWRAIDLDLDRRGKPYTFCAGCGVRVFMSRTTLDELKALGLVWTTERPLDIVQKWVARIAAAVGLQEETRK